MRSGNWILGAVVMLTLVVFRWGDRIVCALEAGGVGPTGAGPKVAPRGVDRTTEEGKQLQREIEALERAEAEMFKHVREK
ncbi:hypothetical protein [Nannocystis sp. SCPEA4]|uniref:hypothetical protein n=1 Tax=Nannocystis sp. SCPEA4 TaxID=2996787 RepID=UPI002270D80F|nr:hypothetical protein [Nannocystis sp. SCPEA4]MCY1056568.1 hypothetical protein [Nannocystis sp. SCPEA4]